MLNDHPVAFIVDTGARNSLIWPKEVERLGLDSQFGSVRLKGTGGEVFGGVAEAETLGLGVATAKRVQFVTAGNLFDGRTIAGFPVIGLLGADFLSEYDAFFDLPDRRINLYQVEGCKAQLAAWTSSYEKIKVSDDSRDSTKIVVTFKLNGKSVDAFLDSGSRRTLIAQSDAIDAGVHRSDFKTDQKGISYGIDDEKTQSSLHQFDSFELRSIHIKNPKFFVSDTENTLLGADFFRHRRIWIPRFSREIFIKHVLKSEPPNSQVAPFVQ